MAAKTTYRFLIITVLGAVLITRLVGIVDKEVYQLAADYNYYHDYFGYYDHALSQLNSGYYSSYKLLTLESALYDTASGNLIWSMQSETIDASQPRQIIEDQI